MFDDRSFSSSSFDSRSWLGIGAVVTAVANAFITLFRRKRRM